MKHLPDVLGWFDEIITVSIRVLKFATLLSLCALIIALTLVTFQFSYVLTTVRTNIQGVSGELGSTIAEVRNHTIPAADSTVANAGSAFASIKGLADAGKKVAVNSRGVVSDARETMQLINAPCGGSGKSTCGLIANANTTLHTARGTMGQAEVAMHHEAGQLDAVNAQEIALYSHIDETITEGHQALVDADALVADPETKRLIAESAATMTEVHGVTKDMRIEVDKFVAPKTKWQRLYTGAWFGTKLALCKLVGVPCTI
jgi:hypothetical protein